MQVTGADFNVGVRGRQPAERQQAVGDGRWPFDLCRCAGRAWSGRAIPVTLPEIKRIEVLKGAASVLYGFNAFDGSRQHHHEVTGGDRRARPMQIRRRRPMARFQQRRRVVPIGMGKFGYRLSYRSRPDYSSGAIGRRPGVSRNNKVQCADGVCPG